MILRLDLSIFVEKLSGDGNLEMSKLKFHGFLYKFVGSYCRSTDGANFD
jgi:hypothetical protein